MVPTPIGATSVAPGVGMSAVPKPTSVVNAAPATKKIAITGNTTSTYYTPAAADDPVVKAYLLTNAITMYSQVGTAAVAQVQPYISGYSMNFSLGYSMSYSNSGKNWGAGSYQGCAFSVGYPQANGTNINADSFPILLGLQNVNVYCSVVTGSGVDILPMKCEKVKTIVIRHCAG